MENELIIDTHSFLGKSDGFGVVEDTGGYFDKEQFQATKFLTIAFNSSENQLVLQRIRNDDKFLGVYLMFNPNQNTSQWRAEYDALAVIEDLARQEYVVGLKSFPSLFHTPLNDQKYFPFYELAIAMDIPVLLHCSSSGSDFSSAEMIRDVCNKYPQLKLILAHFGGLNLEYMKAAVAICKENRHVYLNTTAIDPLQKKRQVSSSTYTAKPKVVTITREHVFEIFQEAVKSVPHQILFGSDLGYYPPDGYSMWPITELPQQEARVILRDNPLSLFGKKMKKF